ncbi:hypothetical protein PAAG_04832 [Paracoccidioides lutzii Pb01]|uniref:Protein kinase domain-containing protein n=1 Tax=Paracoccidioides lutzii (strain ATCC MYA-826 / Pb01) TaxID=502779 RepID=C1H1P6_PARBA|nr:hypothetical protein PAAG_04832 [Paracoccidioides lutzii Pb01]EEH33783.2 hypothetical protein PAAG_04832 [Paracoccidioides lutzii Pb01]
MTYQLSASYCARYNMSKPPLPYFPGQEFCIHPHTPPAPATGEVVLSYEGASEKRKYASCGSLVAYLSHPPLPGLTGKCTIRLKVVGPVRIGDQHSAQLVTVHMYLLAKLYDPLSFDHEQDDVDPFRYTDLAYSHETAAYRLLCPLEGTVIPRYYGSFTLELPIPNKKNFAIYPVNPYRKKYPGISMQRLNPTNYTRSERQNIMKAIVDAESMLYAHDILHRDIHPRNVLVLDSAHRRVVLIDFGYCGIGRTPSNSPAEWKAKYLVFPYLLCCAGIRVGAVMRIFMNGLTGTGKLGLSTRITALHYKSYPRSKCATSSHLDSHSPCPPAHEADGIRAATGTDLSPREASDLSDLGRPGEDQAGGSRPSLSEEKKCRAVEEHIGSAPGPLTCPATLTIYLRYAERPQVRYPSLHQDGYGELSRVTHLQVT